MEMLRDIPGYKAALKAVLKAQIQFLVIVYCNIMQDKGSCFLIIKKVWGIMLYPPFKNLRSSVRPSVCWYGPTLGCLGVIFASKIRFILLRIH